MNTWNLPDWLYVAGALGCLALAALGGAIRARRQRAATRRRWAAVHMRRTHAIHILGSRPADLPDVQVQPRMLSADDWDRLTQEREELF